MPIDNIQTAGIEVLARERPDILILICRDNFLPPTQLIKALKALEWYPDKEGMLEFLVPLLSHYSISVSQQAATTLGIETPDEPAAS